MRRIESHPFVSLAVEDAANILGIPLGIPSICELPYTLMDRSEAKPVWMRFNCYKPDREFDELNLRGDALIGSIREEIRFLSLNVSVERLVLASNVDDTLRQLANMLSADITEDRILTRFSLNAEQMIMRREILTEKPRLFRFLS